MARCAVPSGVPYDEALAGRIRALLAGEEDLTERRMFGGLAFLVAGNLAVSASGRGGLLVRVDPASSADLVATTGAEPMVMRGSPMLGWLLVGLDALGDDDALATWVERGTAFARSLPAKGTG